LGLLRTFWMTVNGRKCQFAILPDDRQQYGVEQLFNNRRFGNLELAQPAKSGTVNPNIRRLETVAVR
jgi:hypothetical protein